MGATILTLPSAADDVLIDEGIIRDLRDCVGDGVCRELVIDAVLETTERLASLEVALARRDVAEVGRLAHNLVSTPGQIGMTMLSVVSKQLADCVEAGDWPTIRAVGERLLRVGQETLAAYPVLTL